MVISMVKYIMCEYNSAAERYMEFKFHMNIHSRGQKQRMKKE